MVESKPTYTPNRLAQSILKGLGLGAIISAGFIGGYLYRELAYSPALSDEKYRLVSEADSLLAQNFLGEYPDDQTRIHGAVSGLVGSLKDPHTFFVEPVQAELDSNRLAGSFGGIGTEVGRDSSGTFIFTRVYRNGPAASAGLVSGDQLVSIDGVPVNHSDPDDRNVQASITGEIGSTVSITVIRGTEQLEVTVTRAEVIVPSTFWQVSSSEPQIGIIQITSFGDRTSSEVKQAISELDNEAAEALVLDLRNNGGGLVDSAVEVISEFVDGGPILFERRNDGNEQLFNAIGGGTAVKLPLIVLVNANTASAAEIVGGALQDRGRAILIGQKTYGKGTVQVIFALSDGSSLHITTAEWLTPNRHRIEATGLTPDVITGIVEGTDSEMDAAIELLLEQISG